MQRKKRQKSTKKRARPRSRSRRSARKRRPNGRASPLISSCSIVAVETRAPTRARGAVCSTHGGVRACASTRRHRALCRCFARRRPKRLRRPRPAATDFDFSQICNVWQRASPQKSETSIPSDALSDDAAPAWSSRDYETAVRDAFEPRESTTTTLTTATFLAVGGWRRYLGEARDRHDGKQIVAIAPSARIIIIRRPAPRGAHALPA